DLAHLDRAPPGVRIALRELDRLAAVLHAHQAVPADRLLRLCERAIGGRDLATTRFDTRWGRILRERRGLKESSGTLERFAEGDHLAQLRPVGIGEPGRDAKGQQERRALFGVGERVPALHAMHLDVSLAR